MQLTDKLVQIAENELKVYNDGKFSVVENIEPFYGQEQGLAVVASNVTTVDHELGVRLSSKNLWGSNNILEGYVESGAGRVVPPEYDREELTLDYISCVPLQTYTMQSVLTELPSGGYQWCTIAFYDSEKKFISRPAKAGTIDNLTINYITATAPANAAYMRASARTYGNAKLQLEVGITPTAYTPYNYNTDFTDYKIKVSGKNLLNINREFGTLSSGNINTSVRKDFDYSKYYLGLAINNYYYPSFIEATIENNTITYKGKSTAYYGIAFPFKAMPNTVYSFSCIVSADKARQAVAVSFYDKDGAYISNTTNATFTTPSNCYTAVFILRAPDTANTYTASDIQIEYGSTVTAFEPYTDLYAEYYATTDGIVKGVKSFAPNMTLISENNDAIINANYIKDIDKVFEETITQIALSGGE